MEPELIDDSQSSADDSFISNNQSHTDLDELWDQLNLTPEQKQRERIKLQNEIKQETKAIIEKEFKQKSELLYEINDIREKTIKFLQALGKTEKIGEISKLGINGTILQRLNEVKSSYDKYLPLYIVRVKLFSDLYNRINTLFDKIGYDSSSREGFVNFDNNDLSPEKEDR